MKNVDWSKWNSKENNFKKYSTIPSELIYGQKADNLGYVSIVVITYKRAHGLRNALESALHQDYKNPYWITVLDDSGFDQETDDLMKEFCAQYKNISYYRNQKNLGQYANWNRACELSPTEWFCLLHDDDWLKPNYLSEVTRALENERNKGIGLLGVYFTTVDMRKGKKAGFSTNFINALTSLFISLRRKRPIPMTLNDNIKLIYTLSCCLMINRDKVMDIGGLDDAYFPSADFVLTSKMNYYHSTAFLPEYLCYRGIGENESLKQEVCEDSIRCAYHHTMAMIDTTQPELPLKLKKRAASFSAVSAEIGVLGYNDTDYSNIKHELGMDRAYDSKLRRFAIMLQSRFYWGMLIFRPSTRKNI